MDHIKAKTLFEQLHHESVDGVEIIRLINNGKSAAVFEGTKDGVLFAVKVFDNELIETFGVEIQEARINLELKLTNHKIPNLIKIIGGGKINIGATEYHYITMEYVHGKNLKDFINEENYDIEFIRKVSLTLLQVTESLLRNTPQIAHRDIKPENIMISNNKEIILMDLGVLKVIGTQTITDIGQKQFLGTLRYSAPEFLTRNELDDVDGWRAINYYQIGGVIHDLVMKQELFSGVEPYANLVIAIKEDAPRIYSDKYPGNILQLARNLLIKNPKRRIELNNLDIISKELEENSEKTKDPSSIFHSIQEETASVRYDLVDIENIQRSKVEKEEIKKEINAEIFAMISQCIKKVSRYPMVKSLQEYGPTQIRELLRDNFKVTSQIIQFEGSLEYGIVRPVCIFIRVDNNESSDCSISMSGVVLGAFNRKKTTNYREKLAMLFSNNNLAPRQGQVQKFQITYNTLFEGVFDNSDNEIKVLIETNLLLIFKKAIEYMKPEVEAEIKQRKKQLDGNSGVSASMRTTPQNYIISDF